jgi:hypothetical protein
MLLKRKEGKKKKQKKTKEKKKDFITKLKQEEKRWIP